MSGVFKIIATTRFDVDTRNFEELLSVVSRWLYIMMMIKKKWWMLHLWYLLGSCCWIVGGGLEYIL